MESPLRDDDDDRVMWPLKFETVLFAIYNDCVTPLQLEIGKLKSLGFDVNLRFGVEGYPEDDAVY